MWPYEIRNDTRFQPLSLAETFPHGELDLFSGKLPFDTHNILLKKMNAPMKKDAGKIKMFQSK